MLCKHAAEAGTLKPKPAHQDSTGAHKQSLRATLSGLRRSSALQAELSCAVGISSSFLSLLEQGRTDIAIGRLLHVAGPMTSSTGLLVATLEGHSGGGSVAFSADAADTRQRRPRRESAVVGSCQRRAGRDAGGPERRYDLSGLLARRAPPGELLLASAAVDGAVRLWDIRKRASISQLGIGVALLALAWGPCGITVGTSAGASFISVSSSASGTRSTPNLVWRFSVR